VFHVGEKVEAKFRDGSKWFKGRISRANRDGTYDVTYEDGDKEEAVKHACLRPAVRADANNLTSLR
jgi:hypothetical protein